MDWVIEAKNLKKSYKNKSEMVHAVNDVSLQVAAGETLGIIGESGSGKSTLGRLLIQLEKQDAGEIFLHQKPCKEWLKKNRLQFHRNCQMVFQNPFDTFDSRYRLKKIFLEPMKLHKIGKDEKERLYIIEEMLTKAGLYPVEDYLKRYPHEMSGGQLQRISILRAMLLNPSLLVADEPVSMLDISVRAEIIQMLRRLVQEQKIALILISHDIATTRYIADRIAVMQHGKIVEMGRTEDILNNPVHPYTKQLIACSDFEL